MNVPLLDLKAQYAGIKADVLAALNPLFDSQMFILGKPVEELERNVAAYCGCEHGVGISSGTDALLVALMAEEIGPGDEVITSPYTFFATAGSIVRVGALPRFADIDPRTCNLDPAGIERQITPRTRAIMVVHLYGQCVDMDPVLDLAQRHKLTVIEDACQAIGAEYHGRRAGSMGDYGCLSFFPSKNLGCFGDGGMLVTRDAARAERVRILRNHGMNPKYYHKLVGGNFRLDALQAAVLNVKLPHLDDWTAARQRNAALYARLFAQTGLLGKKILALPDAVVPGRHVYNQYIPRVTRRDALREWLTARGIGTEVYYPVPLHRQECFTGLGYPEGAFPHSEAAARETIALPVYPELDARQIEYVVQQIAEFYRTA